MTASRLALVTSLILSAAVAACAPVIMITHADLTHPTARVYVDGEDEGPIEYGETLSTRVEWGQHHILVVDEATENCVWAGEEEGWLIWVLDEVELTLLPHLDEPSMNEADDDER